MQQSLRRGVLLAALVAALTPYFVNLGGSTIWDANEAYYVETPREMLESGDHINPSFNYEPRFNKPVLSYWMVAGLYHLFGVSVATERIAIVACGLVMLTAAFMLGRALTGSVEAGLLATLGLAVGPRFFMFSRRILIDMANSAALSMILVFFVLSELYPERRRRFLYFMYVAAGVGMLIKGPVAVILPVAAFTVYLALHGELRRLAEMRLVQGALIVLLIVAPWYVRLYTLHGWTYITQFFMVENVERYLEPFGPNDSRGTFFYLPVLLTDSFPWSLAAIGAVAAWWANRRQRTVDPSWRIRTLLLTWCAVFVLFFSFSRSKQDLYIFPVTPALAALGGSFVFALLGSDSPSARRWFVGTFTAIGTVLLVLGALVVTVFVGASSIYPLDGALPVGLVAALGGAAVAVLAWRDARRAAVLAVLGTLIVVNWLLAVWVVPGFEVYKPVAPLSAQIERRLREGDVVVQFDVALPSMTYYLRRRVEMTVDRIQLREVRARSTGRLFAVMPESRFEEVRSDLGESACVVARHRSTDVKLRNVLAGTPPRQVIVAEAPCSS